VTSTRRQLTLSTGRIVYLRFLQQWDVYANILEGLPTREQNDADLKALVDEARQRDGHDPILITPAQRPLEHDGPYPFGEPAALPAVGCLGRFHSNLPARDRSKDHSDLTIIWFQDEYAFPISPDVERAILAVDWDRLARDGNY
jgi:hypothetical protein